MHGEFGQIPLGVLFLYTKIMMWFLLCMD